LTVTSAGGAQTAANIDTISFTDSTNAATITVGDGTNNAVTLTVNGNVDGDGTADLSFIVTNNGAGTDNEAMTLAIKSTTFNLGSGTITLTDDATDNQGDAALLINGTGAQALTGIINGANQGEGTVSVTNTGGTVTFNSGVGSGTEVGAISIGGATGTSTVVFEEVVQTNDADNETGIITIGQTDGGSAVATFKKTVTTDQGIVLGTGAGTADTATVNFDATGAGFTVTGAISAGDAADTTTVNVLGGNTVTFATAMGTNVDALNIADATILANTGGGAIDADTITFQGSTAELNMTAAGTITGDLVGSSASYGILDVDAATTVTGNIGGASATAGNALSTIEVADNVALTIVPPAATNVVLNFGTLTLQDDDGTADGTDSSLVIDPDNGAVTVIGDIATAVTSDNGIVINDDAGGNAVAFQGNIGTASATLQTLAMENAGGNAQTVSTTGNLYVDAITLDANDTLQFLGTSAQTVSGTIAGLGAGEGILTVGNGTTTSDVTFSGVIGGTTLASATVSANATARFNANATVAGTLTNTGTTRVGAGATVEAAVLTDTGSYVLAASDADTTDALAEANFGRLDDTGNNGTLTASRVSIDVQSQLATGTVELAEGINLGAATLADNSFQYSFVVANAGANSNVTVSRRTLEDIADGSQLTNGAAETLDGLIASTDTEIAAINANLAAASSQEAVNDVLKSVSPTVDAGAVTGATSFTTSTRNVTNTQLASLRDGTEASGMYAGNVTNGLRGWVQGFGQTGDQDVRDGVAGYDVDSYGIAVGLDTESLAENWIWGVAFAYADTEVDSDGVNNTKTDIDSYQVSLYGNYDLDDRTYIAGQVGYVWGDNDQTRSNVGGVNGLTATSDYDSNVYFASLEAGRKYMVGGNTVLTPKALVNYQYYDADGYTETGAGGANLTTSGDDLDLFEIGVGVDASWDYQQADGSYLQPKIGVGVRHDLVGDEYQTSSTFQAGGSSFKTEGFDPAQTTFNVSAGLTYFSTTNWELSAGYDFEVKSDYDSHAGKLKAAYKF